MAKMTSVFLTLAAFLGAATAQTCDGDINGDGTTNVIDLLALLGDFNCVGGTGGGSCDAIPDAETTASLTAEQDGLTITGHAILTEWGLHLDGVGDAAYLTTGDYGADASFSYSFWYSKSSLSYE